MKPATAIRPDTGHSRKPLPAALRVEGTVLTAGFTMDTRAVGPRNRYAKDEEC